MGPLASALPPCGLYRTTRPLPGHETRVPSGVLVYFHNHSEEGLPQVLLPETSRFNRWHFHGAGIQFRSLPWATSLLSVPAQGFYALKDKLAFDGGEWPKGTLVQLGYTRSADPVLFIAQQRRGLAENDLFFSHVGVRIGLDRLHLLEPLTVYVEPGGDDAGDTG